MSKDQLQKAPSDLLCSVVKDLLDREQVGLKKYGVTLDRQDLTEDQWMQHAYEECLDQACYLKKILINRGIAKNVD